MAARRYAYGISILGFGIGRGLNSSGVYREHLAVRFSTVDMELSDGTKIDRVYVDSIWGGDAGGTGGETMRTVMPQVRSLRVEPFEGSGQFGSLSARIQIDKHNGTLANKWKDLSPSEHLAKFLMGSKPRPWGRVWQSAAASYIEDIDKDPHSTWGDIVIQRYRNRPELAVGDLFYWGRELLQVSLWANYGYGASPVTALPDANAIIHLRRGVCGSRQETHKISDYDDVEIFLRNPVLKGRDAQVWKLDLDSGTETLIWEGILDRPEASDSFGFIEISGNGSIAWAGELRPGWKRAYWSFDSSQRDNITGAIKSTHVRNEAIVPLESPGGADMVVVRGSAVQPIKLNFTRDRDGGLYRYEVAGTFSPIMGTYSDRKKEEKTDEQAPPMKEVLVGDRRYTHFYRPLSEEYLLHPFDVLRCLLCSTGTRSAGADSGKNGDYDVLPPGWGLGFPDSRVDHAGIDALKSPPTSTDPGGPWYLGAGLEMTNLLIGNEDHTFLQVFERILKPLLCFLTVTSDAKLTIKHLRDSGESGVQFSYTEDDMTKVPKQSGMAYEPRTDVRYKISRRGASGEYSGEVVATNIRRAEGNRYRSVATDEEVDALDYGDPSIASGSFEDTEAGRSLQALAALRYDMLNMSYNEWEIGVQDLDSALVPGTVINVRSMQMFDPDDSDVVRTGTKYTRCMVTEQTTEPGTFDQTCTVINIGAGFEGAQNLAPAWRIGSVAGSDSFTLDDSGGFGSPRSAMTNKMTVTIANPDCENLVTTYGTRTPSAYDSGTGVVTLGSGFLVAPSIGQYLILSFYTSLSTLSPVATNLGYCYLSDIEGHLDSSDESDLEGHTWGQ